MQKSVKGGPVQHLGPTIIYGRVVANRLPCACERLLAIDIYLSASLWVPQSSTGMRLEVKLAPMWTWKISSYWCVRSNVGPTIISAVRSCVHKCGWEIDRDDVCHKFMMVYTKIWSWSLCALIVVLKTTMTRPSRLLGNCYSQCCASCFLNMNFNKKQWHHI